MSNIRFPWQSVSFEAKFCECSLPQSDHPIRSYLAVTHLWVPHRRPPMSQRRPTHLKQHHGHAGGYDKMMKLIPILVTHWGIGVFFYCIDCGWATSLFASRVACQWTQSQTWMTTSPAFSRHCSSLCRLKRQVKRRSTGTKGWASIPFTVRCPEWWTAAVSTSRNTVSISVKHIMLIQSFSRPQWPQWQELERAQDWVLSLFCSGLQTVGIFRVGSSKKRVRQVSVSVKITFTARQPSQLQHSTWDQAPYLILDLTCQKKRMLSVKPLNHGKVSALFNGTKVYGTS